MRINTNMAAPMIFLPKNKISNVLQNIGRHVKHYSESVYKTHSEYCMDLVRKSDYENFLATLLLPRLTRSTVFAIRAANVEISQIHDTVSDSNIGLMRIQFWKDSINNIYKGKPPHTPIALELTKAVKRHNISKQWLMRLLIARESRMNNQQFKNMDEVEEYSDNSVTPIYYLILESLGIKDINADHVASHIGKTHGIVTLLRSTLFHSSRQHVYLPLDLMIQYNVSQQDLIRGIKEQKVKDLVYDIASIAHQHLTKARSLKADLPPNAYKAFLSTAGLEAYLTRLQKADFDLFHPQLQQRYHWLPISLWIQKLREIF
ncbi:NADH dehydrogenase (ubiquinone) complex I, assembly factor 6-like [Tubulanus polymorphus]|uniref:NADH dehydrogenase (ubiquinone) complex I, assembly factor 6-like n=1 Tax=Tubulanus polymorphus TaxID=672921 RepID=UPI003DA62E41